MEPVKVGKLIQKLRKDKKLTQQEIWYIINYQKRSDYGKYK